MDKSEMSNEKLKFIRIALGIYAGTLALSVVFSIFSSLTSGTSIMIGAGNIVLYGGVFFFVLGFLIKGSSKGLHRRETFEQFQLRRKGEKPLELVTWAISTGGLLLVFSGYTFLYLIAPGIQ